MGKQGKERLHLDGGAAIAGELRSLALHHLDSLLDGEGLCLGRVVGDADDEMIHELDGARDDTGMAEGQRLEGAGIRPVASGAHVPASVSPSLSPVLSAMRSTDTTRSPSSIRNSTTPVAERRWMLIEETGTRMVWPR